MLQKIQTISSGNLFDENIQKKKIASQGGENFNATLKGFINEVNDLQKDAGESINKLAAGEINDVHDVMVAVEKASTSFDLMMQIRNKILEAYREVMRTQV
ncbi:flagellar hook-basal body complex protein FliE [bacterium BMS3Abin05]|nr:flagellar hook-basal body complex protein FliE [bacterium BMS3Abin05]GBE27910.1 flagellar hook-basal body complex protein FliE [bacterium BMS3Bbin03]HDK35886.1 flagellar hook-basal body complex protein FliE [Bacteroidota bacterium]HDZ12394.1 flagellar hook-basal body complex protein FliE [Bacteroidota bacterium]